MDTGVIVYIRWLTWYCVYKVYSKISIHYKKHFADASDK